MAENGHCGSGPAANFLLAIFVFWLIHVSYGVSGIAPVVNGVLDESAAETAGLREGDEILTVDGEPTMIWQQVTLNCWRVSGKPAQST